MPFIKIYIHLVFSTLDRKPLLHSSDVRIKLWKHIKQNGTEKGIFIDMINGYSDHCHCLIFCRNYRKINRGTQFSSFKNN